MYLLTWREMHGMKARIHIVLNRAKRVNAILFSNCPFTFLLHTLYHSFSCVYTRSHWIPPFVYALDGFHNI